VVCKGNEVFRTYFTSGRGVEALGSVWTFLDLTPLGCQETVGDSPENWPQRAVCVVAPPRRVRKLSVPSRQSMACGFGEGRFEL
jgi:hypothetical protein